MMKNSTWALFCFALFAIDYVVNGSDNSFIAAAIFAATCLICKAIEELQSKGAVNDRRD